MVFPLPPWSLGSLTLSIPITPRLAGIHLSTQLVRAFPTGDWPFFADSLFSDDWWSTCTGNSNKFSTTCPLVIARYGASPGTIPGGWGYQTIWQNSDAYAYGGDSDIFNGDYTRLQALATG